MIVDYLRSCYSAQMLFSEGNPPVWVDWYFVPPSTPVLPYYTRFASGNWAHFKFANSWTGPGEVSPDPTTRPWRYGGRVGDATGNSGPCGTAEQWAGQISLPWPPQIIDPAGTPRCCFVPRTYSWQPIFHPALALQVTFSQPSTLALSTELTELGPVALALNLATSASTGPALSAVVQLLTELPELGPLPASQALSLAISPQGIHEGETVATPSAVLGMSAKMYTPTMITPAGGCGSLPAQLLCAVSSPGCPALDGMLIHLAWSASNNWWEGTTTVGPDQFSFTLVCQVGSWVWEMFWFSFIQSGGGATGTSGPAPELSSPVPGIWTNGPCPGMSFNFVLTADY